jgi:5-methylcytosine-specific restriction enzyme subunit McrC
MAFIPVANIYYMLCYAWDEFAPLQIDRYAAEDFPDTLHLFSRQLIAGLGALHRQGFETDYIPLEESTSAPRGRILIAPSIRTMTRQPGKVYCAFDEMSADIRSNQILKATLHRLLGEGTLQIPIRKELRQTIGLLANVRAIELNARVFHDVRLHQNNRLYSFLLTISRFLFESMEAQDRAGEYRFRDVDRDEKRMRRIFEKFVRNFFVRRQSTFKDVKSERMDWFATAEGGSDLNLLPLMNTDVTLRSASRTIIIECKYTESLYQSRFLVEKLRSSHLYQLGAYLRNIENNGGADRKAEGILLYPTAGKSLEQSFRLHGHRVSIRTLDLNQPWTMIEEQLLSLIRSQREWNASGANMLSS